MGMFIAVIALWCHNSFLPNGSPWQVYPLNSGGWLVSLLNGSYPVVLHRRSMTSSIMGPWEEVSCSGPLRATILMDVVTVSMCMTPVISSFTMQLVHMVANLGMVTTSTASGLEDILGALSGDSSFFRQAITP